MAGDYVDDGQVVGGAGVDAALLDTDLGVHSGKMLLDKPPDGVLDVVGAGAVPAVGVHRGAVVETDLGMGRKGFTGPPWQHFFKILLDQN